jgi:hypothetical protein
MEQGDPPPKKFLAIGPCAMGFFALLGALRNVDMSTIEEISGSSAGAVLGLMLCLGKSVSAILEMTIGLDFVALAKPDLTSMVTRYGLIPIDPIKRKLIELCDGQNPRFRDLPKKLYVTAFCLNTSETEYFSRDTVPDMPVIDIVCMSIAVPFLFESSTYRDRIYVDGGLVETVPVAPFLGRRREEVLALRLVITELSAEIKTLKQFVTRLIHSSLRSIEYPHSKHVTVETCDIFDFAMSIETRLKLFLLHK